MATVLQTSPATRHFEVIDVIRGLAALSVAMLHIREVNWIGMRAFQASHGIDFSLDSLLSYLSFPVVWGSIGVPIFFVISGYVIHHGSRDKVANLDQAKVFWLRRFVRIYPTFIAALLLTFALDMFSRAHGFHEKLGDVSLGNALLNLFALVGISGTPYGSNGALWSLSIEIQFYAVYPLALIAWRRLGPLNMLWLTLALTAAGIAISRLFGVDCFLIYYFSWWLGAYVADRQGQSVASPRKLAIAICGLAAGCAVFFLKSGIATHMFWSLGFAVLLEYLLSRQPNVRPTQKFQGAKTFVRRALAKCGDFSYSLYAVHLPIAVAFNVYLLGGAKQTSLVWALLNLVIAVIGGYLVYLAVEVPSIKMLKVLSRKTSRSVPVAAT